MTFPDYPHLGTVPIKKSEAIGLEHLDRFTIQEISLTAKASGMHLVANGMAKQIRTKDGQIPVQHRLTALDALWHNARLAVLFTIITAVFIGKPRRLSPLEGVQALMARIALAACLILLIGLAQEKLVGAQDIARLQSGVVKITAKPPNGTTNVGTGFIVRLETNAAYIVTAAHVVAGDAHPKVEFFTKRNMPVTAEVLGLEGDDEVRGLALVVVRGTENLPKGITALSLAVTTRLSEGEDILVIGFPRNAGPWALIKGNISSRQGRDMYFSPSVDSGHSGGPVFHSGKVVAMVGAGSQSVGRGVTVRSVQDYIEGFGITAQEGRVRHQWRSNPRPRPPQRPNRRPRPMTQDREITGKDGAPMVLIPAGEFWMGSPDGEGDKDEHPRHQVYLDAYSMDKFEVTVSRYAEFLRSTGRQAPDLLGPK